MSDTDKSKSIRDWETFRDRCAIGHAARRRIIERKQAHRQQILKEAK